MAQDNDNTQEPQSTEKLKNRWAEEMNKVVGLMLNMGYPAMTDNKQGIEITKENFGKDRIEYDTNSLEGLKQALKADLADLRKDGLGKKADEAMAILDGMNGIDSQIKMQERPGKLAEINENLAESGSKLRILPTQDMDSLKRESAALKQAADKVDVQDILDPVMMSKLKINGLLPKNFDNMRDDVKLEKLLEANNKQGGNLLTKATVEEINTVLASTRVERLIASDEALSMRSGKPVEQAAERTNAPQADEKSREEMIADFNKNLRGYMNKQMPLEVDAKPENVQAARKQVGDVSKDKESLQDMFAEKGVQGKIFDAIKNGELPKNFNEMKFEDKLDRLLDRDRDMQNSDKITNTKDRMDAARVLTADALDKVIEKDKGSKKIGMGEIKGLDEELKSIREAMAKSGAVMDGDVRGTTPQVAAANGMVKDRSASAGLA
jgi:hypothetical protein